MTPTLITAKNGKARPKNPYDNEFKDEYHFYAEFESTFQWHDCPECEDGEFEAELVWQVKGPFGIWEDISDLAHDNFRKSNENPVAKSYIMREVWRIVPQPQEPSDRVKKLHDMSVPMKEGDRFYREKEEAKTVEGKIEKRVINASLPKHDSFEPFIFNDKVDKPLGWDESIEFAQASYCSLDPSIDNTPRQMREKAISAWSFQAGANWYSTQKNTALMEENARLIKAIEYALNKVYTLEHTQNGVKKHIRVDLLKAKAELEKALKPTL